jgi:hypothetical protein
MTILYSNGCSFTANTKLEREYRYPLLVGEHFGWEVHDRAIAGNCNSKIIRCTMRDCLRLLGRKEDIVALVQLTFKERWEYAGNPIGPNQWQYGWCEDLFEVIKPSDENNWPPEIKNYAKQIFLSQKPNALYSQLFSNLLGLVSFFKHNKINYKIFAGSWVINDDFKSFEDDAFYKYLSQDTNIIDLSEFNMLGLTGQQTHPYRDGMAKIADYFINLLGAPA